MVHSHSQTCLKQSSQNNIETRYVHHVYHHTYFEKSAVKTTMPDTKFDCFLFKPIENGTDSFFKLRQFDCLPRIQLHINLSNQAFDPNRCIFKIATNLINCNKLDLQNDHDHVNLT